MKPHPHIRKTIKWGGAAVTLLLVVAWIGSGWWSAGYVGPGGTGAVVSGGCLRAAMGISEPGAAAERGWLVGANQCPRGWWFLTSPYAGGRILLMSLWMPALLSLGLTIPAWRLDALARRRATLTLCPKCNYDLAGLRGGAAGVVGGVGGVGVKCPECGAIPKSA